jgi:hypothetical protein
MRLPWRVLWFTFASSTQLSSCAISVNITTFVGCPPQSACPVTVQDGVGTVASLFSPVALAMDISTRTMFVSDSVHHQIRQVSLNTANMTTLAGRNGTTSGFSDGYYGQLNAPHGIAFDTARNHLIVADSGNAAIRAVSHSGVIYTVAGNGTQGLTDGYGNITARFMTPTHVAYCGYNRNTYITDADAHSIRVLSPDGLVRTWVGNSTHCDFVNDVGTKARLCFPSSLACDTSGNLFVWTTSNEVQARAVVRKITPLGNVSTLAGTGGALIFYQDGVGSNAVFSAIDHIRASAVDSQGNLYVADQFNARIRRVTPSGMVSTIAGIGPGYSTYTDGPASIVRLSSLAGMVWDSTLDHLYVADVQVQQNSASGHVGHIARATQIVSPTQCAAGTFLQYNTDGSNSSCTLCPTGKFCAAGMGWCAMAVGFTGEDCVTVHHPRVVCFKQELSMPLSVPWGSSAWHQPCSPQLPAPLVITAPLPKKDHCPVSWGNMHPLPPHSVCPVPREPTRSRPQRLAASPVTPDTVAMVLLPHRKLAQRAPCAQSDQPLQLHVRWGHFVSLIPR